MIPEVREIVKKLKEIKELLPDAVTETCNLFDQSTFRQLNQTDDDRNDAIDYCIKAGVLLDVLKDIEIPDTLD